MAAREVETSRSLCGGLLVHEVQEDCCPNSREEEEMTRLQRKALERTEKLVSNALEKLIAYIEEQNPKYEDTDLGKQIATIRWELVEADNWLGSLLSDKD